MKTKKCSKCGEEKNLELFTKNKNKKDGHAYHCKECDKLRQKKYNDEKRDPEKTKENNKKWYNENKEKALLAGKKWRKENREKNLLRHRLYHAKKAGFDNIEDYDKHLIEKRELKKVEIKKRNEEKRKHRKKEVKKRAEKRAMERENNRIQRIKDIQYDIDDNGCHNIASVTTIHGEGYHLIGSQYAHRAVYELYKSKIPTGKIVRHTCDNKACINPKHLIIGTKKDNTGDMIDRGRVDRQEDRGGKLNKLSEIQIEDIYLSDKSSYDLAEIYNVSSTHIRRIKNGSRCANITGHSQ